MPVMYNVVSGGFVYSPVNPHRFQVSQSFRYYHSLFLWFQISEASAAPRWHSGDFGRYLIDRLWLGLYFLGFVLVMPLFT